MKKIRGIGVAGLSLIELIISLAILAIVGTAVGGAMFVSSRSYSRGSSEVSVQEEAQVASSLICDWILDATEVSGGTTDSTPSVLDIVHPEGDKKVQIHIEQNGNELVYTAHDVTDPSVPPALISSGTLASNVTGVQFYSTFADDRNVKISIDFNVNDRTYHSVTDSTSRSHDFVSTSGTSVLGAPAIRFELVSNDGGAHVTLEPRQNTTNTQYTFNVYVDNCDPDTVVFPTPAAPAGANTSIVAFNRVPSTNLWKCTVTSDATASHDDTYMFTVSNAGGSDTKPLTVRIRRINDCSFVNYTTDISTGRHMWDPTTGVVGNAHSTYDNTISLNASNWAQETNIVGANALAIGENGFDAAPWNYVDPTKVQVYFKRWGDGGHTWVDASADVQAYNITSGSVPSIHVELKNDIDYTMAVVVVAPHSGSLSGDPHSNSDPYCGVTALAHRDDIDYIPNNRAMTLDSTAFNYAINRAGNNEAYYDVIYISQGSYNPFPLVGGGIRRGTPACMVAEWDPGFQSHLTSEILSHTSYTTADQVSNDNGAHLSYSTCIYFRPKDPITGLGVGGYDKIVLWNQTNWGNIWADYTARRLRNDGSSVFKYDVGYEIKYEFTTYWDGVVLPDCTYSNVGEVVASTPYVYDPNHAADEATFRNDKYSDKDHALTLTGTGEQTFGLFVDGINVNQQMCQFRCEVYNPTTDSWSTVDNITRWADEQKCVSGSSGPTLQGVTYDKVKLTDGRTYNVGGYDENEPSINNLRVNLEFFNIKKDNMTSGSIYRIVFDTPWKEYEIQQRGVSGGDQNNIVKMHNETTNNYSLGYEFYFTK